MNFEDKLRLYIKDFDFDIRKKPEGFSRYMDQKVTPDVLSFISECIINFLGGKKPETVFTKKDIWDFQYFQKNIVAIFGKPSPTNEAASSEYDKFIAQPLKTLAFSKLLLEEKISNRNTYRVINTELLEYIAQSERNGWIFLSVYAEKVLTDSGFIEKLESYRNKAKLGTVTKEDFEILKSSFESFMRGYTNINGKTEIRRIFPKLINPYAAYHMINGSEDGRMTESRFAYPDLMYNRSNFRDLGKDKAITRQESEEITEGSQEFSEYKIQRAKGVIRRNHSASEVRDSFANGEATQVHHIFPEHAFPRIAAYVENMILLTPQQHNTKAHPGNNTQTIDPLYQRECLLSKIDTVQSFLKKGSDVYSKESLIHVINLGLSLDLSTNTTFDELRTKVNEAYT
jgi:hypothetical protein